MFSIFRVIKFAFQDIIRNFSLSFMTVLILILMLLSVNTFIIIRVFTNEASQAIKKQIDVSIYFDHTADDKKIKEVKDYVTLFPEVIETIFLTKEQVLTQFKEQHKDNVEIVASLDELGDNPLGATLILRTREPGDYQKIIDALRVPEYENIIEAKTFGDTEKAITRIDTITRNVERFGLGLSLLFALIAFLIIFNTVRVAIYTERVEISIKKLVGATNWFIRGPYLVEALIFTIVSIAITAGIVIFALRFLDPYATVVFQRSGILMDYFKIHLLVLTGIQFGVVLVLTALSSLLAMGRHLRV
jgi:cell division transport system permease protein